MINFKNVDLGYGRAPVLKNITCDIRARDVVGLVGPNGAGKTTFLRGVLGLLPARAGDLAIDRSQRFAYVPQIDDLNLYWPLTVREVVSLAARSQNIFGRLSEIDRAAIDEAMDGTDIAALAETRFSTLSGGQRQRAILAQAISRRPDVLLLDEPTRGLDVAVEQDFLALVKKLHAKKNLTLLIVTHTLHIPLNFADKILLFKNGAVITATPDELVKTKKLDELYGINFIHQETAGVRWVAPQ